MTTTKELMNFITFLDNRGLLSITPDKYDYEKAIWEFENALKPIKFVINNPTTNTPEPNNHIHIGGCI